VPKNLISAAGDPRGVRDAPPWPHTGVKVRELMCPAVVTCPPDASLATVATLMTTHGVHSLIVTLPERGTPLIVDDLELVRAALEDADDAQAADIARGPAVMVPSDASLEDAVAMMASSHVAHLLATDPGSRSPVGIVSSFDVAAVLSGWEPRLARIQRPDRATLPGGRTLRETRIGAVMHRGIAYCTPDAPLSVVARTMARHRVHCVAVATVGDTGAGDAHANSGLIEDLDLVMALDREAVVGSAPALATTVQAALPESASLERAAELMVEHSTRHVIALGPDDLPAGMISTLDVAWILAWSRR
jgi:CBS domain-containing protein